MKPEVLKEKLEALQENENFVEALKTAQSKEDLQRVLGEYGIGLTCEEVDCAAAEIERELETGSELSEEALETVAGGVTPWAIFSMVWSVGEKVWKGAWNAGKKFADWESKW